MLFYLSAKEEDKRLIKQFGDDYIAYMQKVPRMNIFLGVIRLLQRRGGGLSMKGWKRHFWWISWSILLVVQIVLSVLHYEKEIAGLELVQHCTRA